MLIYDVVLHDIIKSHPLIYGNIQWHSRCAEMLKNDYLICSRIWGMRTWIYAGDNNA